jgi:hemolysin III
MPSTDPSGMARLVNRAILAATLAFSGIAIAFLLILAPGLRDWWAAVAALVYGATLVASSLCSFLYHTLEKARRRRILRLLDHAAIFLLIAGTYTPFGVVALGGTVGGRLLASVWTLALLGIALKLVLRDGYDRVFVFVYLAIGWVFVIALDDVVRALPPGALALLVAGGAAYTTGALIYFRDIGRWTDPVWHGFVLLGATTHFLAIVAVLPA